MKPFNLEKALAGEPISFKGFKSYLHCSKKEEHFYIVESAVSNTVWSPVNIEELVECTMWEEPRPTVTLTLPCPLEKPRNEMWFIDIDLSVRPHSREPDEVLGALHPAIRKRFDQGLYFASKEDAQAWVDALKNNRK